MFRYLDSELQILLVHPGGPFWARKDEGAWSIPKGEYGDEESALAAARREFQEETGFGIQGQDLIALGSIRQPSRKRITAWAFEGDCDPAALKSNTFSMEWPPKSGKQAEFPEVDRAGWFSVGEARRKIVTGQRGFIEALCRHLEHISGDPTSKGDE